MASTAVPDGEASEITLTAWFHPSMQFSFPMDPKDTPFKVSGNLTIAGLIEKVEDSFDEKSKEAGQPHQMQIQVIWNLKNHTKACSPSDKVDAHFKDGETFGVYGDCLPANSQAPTKQIPEDKKTPVTILTGFLGAGKTTLLNYILQEQTEKKIAVIENEFGEVSIDDALLKGDKLALAEKVIVMDNGCMCCTIRGDLITGLRQILDEINKGSQIDAIMIETTGMADPVPIVRTFMANPAVTDELRLDAVVTVVDAKHILARLDDDEIEKDKVNEAYQQVAFCDKLLLNKLDLVTSEEAIAVKDRIRSINAFAKILPSVKGKVKMAELFNIRAHDMCHFTEADIEVEAEAPNLEHGGIHGGGHGDGHGHGESADKEEHGQGGHDGHGEGHGKGHGQQDGHGHTVKKSRHDTRINSMSIVREGEILPEKLGKWMQSLGTMPPDKGTIFRIKAILAIKGHKWKHVFHAVMDVSDEDDADEWAEGEKRISKIVFIGKSLDEAHLRQGFNSIFDA